MKYDELLDHMVTDYPGLFWVDKLARAPYRLNEQQAVHMLHHLWVNGDIERAKRPPDKPEGSYYRARMRGNRVVAQMEFSDG
jgi:hypothetical protein